MERLQEYEPLWGKWRAKSIIGEGSFGAVYEVESDRIGDSCSCAVKLISFKNGEMLRGVKGNETLSPEELEQLKIKEAKKNVREADLMNQLQGRDHIVTIHDYDIFPGEHATDIIIRMELLMNLEDYMWKYKINSSDKIKSFVIKLGIDICKALEDCEEVGIVHRDIKPDNIFINKNQTFKLGDFGLSRKMSKSASFSLRKAAGTPLYMAPETFGWGVKADYRSDIYSFGLVMYQLLNNGKIPFVNDMRNFDEVDNAIGRRLDGETITAPKYENGQLWKIIEKACQFKKEDRYQSASVMRKDLEELTVKVKIVEKKGKDPQAEKIRKELSSTKNKQKKLEAENKKLFVRLERLKSEKEELEQQTTELNDKNIELEKENDELLEWIEELETKVKETAQQAISKPKGKYEIGSTILFGNYPQNRKASEKQPIKWRILKKEGNKALLISESLLDEHSYHNEIEDVTWETSDIRKWLNNEFYNRAFDKNEKEKINNTFVMEKNNSLSENEGKNSTMDKVFLLSSNEAQDFFSTDEERKTQATAYAKRRGVYVDSKSGYSGWWLRSQGNTKDNAANVRDEGYIDHEGYSVKYSSAGVRPVLWMNMES